MADTDWAKLARAAWRTRSTDGRVAGAGKQRVAEFEALAVGAAARQPGTVFGIGAAGDEAVAALAPAPATERKRQRGRQQVAETRRRQQVRPVEQRHAGGAGADAEQHLEQCEKQHELAETVPDAKRRAVAGVAVEGQPGERDAETGEQAGCGRQQQRGINDGKAADHPGQAPQCQRLVDRKTGDFVRKLGHVVICCVKVE